MNKLILITGTCQMKENKVAYNVHLWAECERTNLTFITSTDRVFDGYNDLWKWAKERAALYFQQDQFLDGAYTIYQDHISLLPKA